MKKFSSIKQHVVIILLGLSTGLTLIFSLIVLITAFLVEDALIYKVVREDADRIEQAYKDTGHIDLHGSNKLSVYPSLDTVPVWAKTRLQRNQSHGELFTPEGTHYHYQKLNLAGRDGYLIVEVSKLLVVSNQPSLFILCILGFFLTMIITGSIALLLSRQIIEPILSLANAVKAYNKPKAVAVMPKLPYELGYLANTFQKSFKKLSHFLEREKAFANNVSHELRTPLTIVNNACTLIKQRGYKASDLKVIEKSCREMEQTVSTLLALARSEDTALQPCKIKVHVENTLLNTQLEVPENWQVDIRIIDSHAVDANPDLFDILLLNLLRNAFEHACHPMLCIELSGHTLSFSNSTDQHITHLTRPGTKHQNSTGIGQGLYLVEQIAEQLGWSFYAEIDETRFNAVLKLQ